MPRAASFDVADHAEGGGLYPGGEGTIKLRIKLHDYMGKMAPESQTAIIMEFHPTDGSNKGEQVIQIYNIGESKDFVPDPEGFRVLIQDNSSRQEMNKSCLGSMFLDKLQACGLDLKKLQVPQGLSVLDGTILRVAEQEQPKREGLEEKPAEPGKKKFKSMWLVPIKATFPWEKGRSTAGRPAAQAATTATATPAPGTTNNAQTGDWDLERALKTALDLNAGSLDRAGIPKAILDVLQPLQLPTTKRMPIMGAAKDWDGAIKELAIVNNWSQEGDVLTVQ